MGYAVAILLAMLRSHRKRLFTPEQLEQIKRDRAGQGMPALEAPRKPYRWWKYSGLS